MTSPALVVTAIGQDTGHHVSIIELMIAAITPATNTLWGVEDPQTDDEWLELENAAIVVIASTQLLRRGGAGPNDDAWAAEVGWQVFVDRLLDAGIASRDAARQKDLDALLTAGDELYPPCEECHLKFHPDMQ